MNTNHLVTAMILGTSLLAASAQAQNRPVLNEQEKAISDQMGHLRSLPDDEWTKSVSMLAKQVQHLPPGPGQNGLVGELGNLVTEGDAGYQTLQTVASTMADILRASPNSPLADSLAQLVHYEHCQVSLDNPRYREALAKLKAQDEQRQNAELMLVDLKGRQWSLKDLRGKVVLVNFWATWCPPCRREMPDLEVLSHRFGPQGLVILAISDEDRAKVEPFIADKKYSYPILLDPGRKVNKSFAVGGIPKSFLFDRDGKLVAQAIDRRTEQQFLVMLKQAGLE